MSRIRDLIDKLTPDERREATVELMRTSRMGQAAAAFFEGLDTNDRDRLAFVLREIYEEHCNEFPGPNSFVKANARSTVYATIDSVIEAICTRG